MCSANESANAPFINSETSFHTWHEVCRWQQALIQPKGTSKQTQSIYSSFSGLIREENSNLYLIMTTNSTIEHDSIRKSSDEKFIDS